MPDAPTDTVKALIQLEVACRIALDALPEIPAQTKQALRDPIKSLCEITERELDRIDPGWRNISEARS
jgi:hypothetical protein